MISRREAQDRRVNRPWQCQAFAVIPAVQDVEAEDHICTLVRQHYGPHQCWCSCLFEDDGAVIYQMRLPPA